MLSLFLITDKYWFIKSYLCVILISPILNTFIERASKSQVCAVLLSYALFQTIYGWLYPSVKFIDNGYSVTSFTFLYFIAAYLKRYCRCNELSKTKILILYAIILSTNTLLSYFSIYFGRPFFSFLFTSYINPLVIIETVLIFLFFSKINFTSKLINFIAASSYSVYLLHIHGSVFESIFGQGVTLIFDTYSGILCLLIMLSFCTVFFVLAIIIDQPRKFIWNKYLSRYFQ